MSFLSILKKVGEGLLLADTAAAPFVTMINPGVGGAMNLIANLAMKAEQVYIGEKQGTTKKQVVLDEFTVLYPMVQEVLQQEAHLNLTFDQTQVGALIDATVAQLNAAKAFRDSFKVEKLPSA